MSPHLHSASLPSLAPPLLPHSLSGTSAHSTCPEASQTPSTRKLLEQHLHTLLQLHCFSYMAIHHACVFHDEGLISFHNWIQAAPRQGSSTTPASAGPFGGAMGGLSILPSPSALTRSSPSLPPIHPYLGANKTGKKPQVCPCLAPPCVQPCFVGWYVPCCSTASRGELFLSIPILHRKCVMQYSSFWIWNSSWSFS